MARVTSEEGTVAKADFIKLSQDLKLLDFGGPMGQEKRKLATPRRERRVGETDEEGNVNINCPKKASDMLIPIWFVRPVRGSELAVLLPAPAAAERGEGSGPRAGGLHHLGHGRGRVPQLGGVPEDRRQHRHEPGAGPPHLPALRQGGVPYRGVKESLRKFYNIRKTQIVNKANHQWVKQSLSSKYCIVKNSQTFVDCSSKLPCLLLIV